MDYHFIEGISDIQETEALSGSRTTLPFSPRHFSQHQHDPLQSYLADQSHHYASYASGQQPSSSFAELREYVEKTLGSWGFKIGYLSQNSENKMTINCLLQLITQRFKEQENRDNLKQTLSNAVYQRNKYQSLLEQEKSATAQKNRIIGRLENAAEELKTKAKQIELASKRQKQDDKKLINMLKSKSEQVMHEIKKREQEIARMKDQMKKNVLSEKSTTKAVNFEVYEIIQRQTNDEVSDRVNALTQKYQTERKNFMKQNLLLRQKIYDIREGIVQFAQWIDVNLFRQKNSCYKNKLIVNHNLLFKKQSLVHQLNEILFNVKSGIKDIIEMHEGRMSLPFKKRQSLEQDQLYAQTKSIENRSPNKQVRESVDMKRPRQTNLIKKKMSVNQQKRQKQQPIVTLPIGSNKLELCEEQQSELSMISHVSAKDILTQNKQFDKWEILFNE